MNGSPDEPNGSLLFDWERPEGEKLLIGACLVGSVILHAFGFYLFQITYPPALSLLSPPRHVNLIAANSEEGRTVLRWVDAEDPALASATLRAPESKARALPKLQHVPSYLSEEPKLKHAPPVNLVLVAPSSHPPGPAPTPPPRIAQPSSFAPTHVLFSEELAGLGQVAAPAPKFILSSNEMPESVRFRVAVGNRGEIRYCFRLNSSGDSGLDEQARQYFLLCRFPQRSAADSSPEKPLLWGIATLQWGNDLALPSPSPTSAP